MWSFTRGKRGVFAFLLVNFEFVLFSYFEVPKSSIFLLSFWGSSFFFRCQRLGGVLLLRILSVFCFTILKFQSFQFSSCILGCLIFFVWSSTRGRWDFFLFLETSNLSFVLISWSSKVYKFLLSFWGSSKNLSEVSQAKKWGMCLSSYELWRLFVFVFWNFEVFNFLLVILGVFNFFVWSSTRGEIEFFFSSCEFWRSFVLVFWSSEIYNFLLIILGFSIFCVKFHKWGMCFSSCELWRILFWYIKIPIFSIFFLSFWRFQMGGNNVGGIVLKYGGLKN